MKSCMLNVRIRSSPWTFMVATRRVSCTFAPITLCWNDEPPPLTKGFHRIGQKQKHSFEPAGITVSRSYAEPEAVHNRGSCAHIPELGHVLGCDAQDMLFSVECLDRMGRQSTRRVAALNSADQNIRVQKYPHL